MPASWLYQKWMGYIFKFHFRSFEGFGFHDESFLVVLYTRQWGQRTSMNHQWKSILRYFLKRLPGPFTSQFSLSYSFRHSYKGPHWFQFPELNFQGGILWLISPWANREGKSTGSSHCVNLVSLWSSIYSSRKVLDLHRSLGHLAFRLTPPAKAFHMRTSTLWEKVDSQVCSRETSKQTCRKRGRMKEGKENKAGRRALVKTCRNKEFMWWWRKEQKEGALRD